MNTRGLHLNRARPVLAVMLAVVALVPTMQPASAQDAGGGVSDFRLPPGPERPPAPVQGPVDDQVPVARPTRTAPPEPAAQPTASPAPVPTTAASPAPAAAGRPQPAPRARPVPTPTPTPTSDTPAPASVSQQGPVPPQAATPVAQPSAAPLTPTPPGVPDAAPQDDGVPVWPLVLIAVALLGGFAAWFWRRRPLDPAGDGAAGWDDPAVSPEDAVAPSPPASLPRTAPAPVPAPPPATAMAGGLAVELDAHHLSRSLVYVTLAYRLTLANRSAAEIGPLRVAADLVSAHASRSREAQLRPAPGELEQRHAVPDLPSGESVTLTGELRLPVASILAIQQGMAQLFVPLARFLVEGESSGPRTFVFVIGQPGETPGAGLRPFRIDAMPGVFRDLDQREIAIAA